MKEFVKAVLQYYMKRMHFKHQIQQAFLKHYELIPVAKGERTKRKPIYEMIEEELRLYPSKRRRHYIMKCLLEIGVAAARTRGEDYFRGIKKR